MVTILKKPTKKQVQLFKCLCGCEFTAEREDYTYCLSVNKEFSYYVMECPHCKVTHIYPYDLVETIEVDVE